MKTNFTLKLAAIIIATLFTFEANAQRGFSYFATGYNINSFVGKSGTPINVNNGAVFSFGRLIHVDRLMQDATVSLTTGKHSYLGVNEIMVDDPRGFGRIPGLSGAQSHEIGLTNLLFEYKIGRVMLPGKLTAYAGIGLCFNLNKMAENFSTDKNVFPKNFRTVLDENKLNENFEPKGELYDVNIAPLIGAKYFINNYFSINMQTAVQILPVFDGQVFKDKDLVNLRYINTTIGIAYYLRPSKMNYRY